MRDKEMRPKPEFPSATLFEASLSDAVGLGGGAGRLVAVTDITDGGRGKTGECHSPPHSPSPQSAVVCSSPSSILRWKCSGRVSLSIYYFSWSERMAQYMARLSLSDYLCGMRISDTGRHRQQYRLGEHAATQCPRICPAVLGLYRPVCRSGW